MEGLKVSLIQELLDIGIDEMKKESRQCMIREQMVDPLLGYVVERLKPYIIGSVVAIVTLFVLLLFLIYLILTAEL